MRTKSEIIEQYKIDYPTLKKGSDKEGYIQLTEEEYNETIERWATDELIALEAKQNFLLARQALLDKLGITEDEARLLLGGN